MKIWTYQEAATQLRREMDIQSETFINEDELMGYFNAAIDDAESMIHTLHEDFFLTSDYVSLVEGESDYDMPSNIYANRIRNVFYNNGTDKYEVTKLSIKNIMHVEDEDDYRYNIENNNGVDGVRFALYPASRVTSSSVMRRWYIRNANRIEDALDNIDIPEFIEYIFAYVKYKVGLKERNPALAVFKQALDQEQVNLKATLKSMIPESNLEFEQDLSFYADFDLDYYYE